MKKFLCTLLMGGLLCAGVSSAAADLPLADGHMLPLTSSISVHQGKDSYMMKDSQGLTSSKEWKDNLLKAMEKQKEVASLSKEDKEILAQEVTFLMENLEVSQIVSDTGDHVYQALVLSFPLTQDSFAHWKQLSAHLAPGKDPKEFSAVTWEDFQTLFTTPITPQWDTTEETALSLGKGLGRILLQQVHWSQNQSNHQVPYVTCSLFTNKEDADGMMSPLYLCALATPSAKQIGFTLIVTNQADGAYFDSYIRHAMEDLK